MKRRCTSRTPSRASRQDGGGAANKSGADGFASQIARPDRPHLSNARALFGLCKFSKRGPPPILANPLALSSGKTQTQEHRLGGTRVESVAEKQTGSDV